MKKERPCLIVCALFAAGVCAQEAPVAARNTPGRYQAMIGGDNTVYVIDTETGAMLSKREPGFGWEIESDGFSNTVAAVRKKQDDARKARKALADLVASTAETFPELSLEDKVKAAADIFVVKVQMCTVRNSLARPRGFVVEYLRKVVGGPKRVYDVGGTFSGFNVDLESGAKKDIIALCFEVRGNGTNVFVCIPTAPVKLWECATYMIVLDASPTIVEDVKKVLAKKE